MADPEFSPDPKLRLELSIVSLRFNAMKLTKDVIAASANVAHGGITCNRTDRRSKLIFRGAKERHATLTVTLCPIVWILAKRSLGGFNNRVRQSLPTQICDGLCTPGNGDVRGHDVASEEPDAHERQTHPLKGKRASREGLQR
jgi:hypothetical protein